MIDEIIKQYLPVPLDLHIPRIPEAGPGVSIVLLTTKHTHGVDDFPRRVTFFLNQLSFISVYRI